jgi:hypothetical protein
MHIVGLLKHGNEKGTLPVVFFFDETESIDSMLADWIEEWLIMPLVQMKHCVVVWTGRRPWRWRRPEIRRRLHSELLEVFEADNVKAQLAANSPTHPGLAETLFRNVYGVTGGHPYASRVAIAQLNRWEDEGKHLDAAHFPDYEPELLTRIYDDFLKGYAFKGRDFDAELVRACELMTLVRLFDTTMLSAVLRACDDQEQFTDWNQEDFGHLLQRLKRTQLLIWNKGFAIDPALRHIARRYFAVCDGETYLTATRAALAVYQLWLKRPVDNRGLFVLEELYHLASLRQSGEPVDLFSEFRRRLNNYREDWIRDPDARRNALERLEGELESDTELKQLTDGKSSSLFVEMVRTEIRRIPETKGFSVLPQNS